MNTTSHPSSGLVPRLWARLFGSDTARLRERLQPAHWLSYVLIIAQSATVLLVFGHAEIPLLVSASLAVRLIAALGVFVLVVSVFAADMAMLATLKRVPALARNRQRWQLREHVAYTLFVLATEAVTLAVVLAALDAAPEELISAKPLIAPGSAVFTAAIVLRVLLVSWTAVQLVIVRGKLGVLLSTLASTGKELVGGHVERKLAVLDIEDISLPAAFRVYAAMSKPPRRVPTWWNGWLVRRELAGEAEEGRQVANVVDALDDLEARTHPPLPAPILPPASPATPVPVPTTTTTTRVIAALPDDDPPSRPPTGPGSPTAQRAPRRRGVRTPRTRKGRTVLRLAPELVEQRIRGVLVVDPAASISKIAREAGVGKSTASKWRGIILAERGQLAQ